MYDCGVVIFGNWAYNWAVDKNLGAMLCIKNGTIVSPEGRKKADLFIEDGKIVSVGGELPFDECWDAEGCLLFPGFIDAHTHLEMDTGSTVTADSFASGTAIVSTASLRPSATTPSTDRFVPKPEISACTGTA